MKGNIPLGIEFFDELIENGCYYIDKTGFIKELLEETFKVNLITRPRRFGKTLTMSMLADFFDIRKDSRRIFEGLEISKYEDFCKEWRNQWPVLFLSLKNVNGDTFEDAYGMLQQEISKLCIFHEYLKDSEAVSEADRNNFIRLINRKGDETDIKCALDTLMRMMAVHYGKSVILLIDGYDVPLAKASDNGYYKKMLNIIQNLLGMVWKTNLSLKFAIVTGCLRIAKESIFTGANNFVSNSISGERYKKYFGFLESEVQKMLEDTGFSEHFTEIKQWYDGYFFGDKEVYCPWDVLNHVSLLQINPMAEPANYWKDTSHNSIIRSFIDKSNVNIGSKFETLLAGGIVQEVIIEDLTYDIINCAEENLWSILYLAGYLTKANVLLDGIRVEKGKTALRIPNEEVKTIFAETVARWFTDTITNMDRKELFDAWWNGEDGKLTETVTDLLFDTISYYDYKENYYHAFVAGLFSGAGYEVSSNKEQGTGRADIVVKDRPNRRAIIIEVKRSEKEEMMQKDCKKALEQIRQKQYAKSFLKGYRTVLCYGAAFFEKECLIKKG